MIKLQRLTLSSLLISISLILSHIEISSFFSFGGSITLFSLIPIMVISLKYNYKWGALCGGVFGILHLMTTNTKFQGLNIISIIFSIFLDYIISYSSIGCLAFFYQKLNKLNYNLEISVIIIFLIRFILHTISGVLIWSSLHDFKTFINVIKFSTIYNFSYIAPEMIINLFGMILIKKFLIKLNIITNSHGI